MLLGVWAGKCRVDCSKREFFESKLHGAIIWLSTSGLPCVVTVVFYGTLGARGENDLVGIMEDFCAGVRSCAAKWGCRCDGRNGLTNAILQSTVLNEGFENVEVHLGGARAGFGGRVLMLGGAPQFRRTPLFMAARKGHLAVVQFLLQADADKETPNLVREGRGRVVGRTNGVRVSCWGLQHGC